MDLNKMKPPITSAQVKSQRFFETINSLGKMADELRAEVEALTKERDALTERVKALTQTLTPILCDKCGIETPDPWHSSEGANKHIHTCDACHAQQVAVPDGEGWYGHKFKEGTRGIWRCDCGKQLTDGENKCTNGTQNTLQSQPLTADAEDTQTHADTYPEREAHALSIPEVVSHEALKADAERYQLLSNYLISDDCQHDDAIVAVARAEVGSA